MKISDWFFLKQKPELKYIGLQDAVINIGRKDSVWNYGFLADYFASPTPKKKGDGLNFDIKKVKSVPLNVTFNKSHGTFK